LKAHGGISFIRIAIQILGERMSNPDVPDMRLPTLASAGHGTRRIGKAPETLNRHGAMALAKRLQQYWHDQGYPAARFWAEPVGERFAKVGTYEIYRVVCNLVDGLPPRCRKTRGNQAERADHGVKLAPLFAHAVLMSEVGPRFSARRAEPGNPIKRSCAAGDCNH
jgi:hypothetical protein